MITLTEPPKEPDDELEKRILAAVDKIDAFAMMDVIISLLKAYGDFAKTMGDI